MRFREGVLFFLLIASVTVKAQERNKVELREALTDLEIRFSVSFTYADQNVGGKYVPEAPQQYNLEEALRHLENNADVKFQRIDNRFIAVLSVPKKLASVCGFLLDSSTSQPVEGAAIISGRRMAVSGSDGSFFLSDIAPDSVILIRSVSYEATRLLPNAFIAGECQNIELSPLLVVLPEVVVSDFITSGINKKIDGSIAIIPDHLGLLPGLVEPDVLYVIQALPGIQSNNETVSDINIRGGTHDQNLILWNGIRMYQTGHFFGLISAFNPQITREVALIKNGTPAYLGDAVSGTLILETDDSKAGHASGSAGVNFLNGDIYVSAPVLKNTTLRLSARRAATDILETPTYNNYFDRIFRDTEVGTSVTNVFDSDETFYFYDYSASLVYEPQEGNKLSFSLINIHNKIAYTESAVTAGKIKSGQSSLVQNNLGFGIDYSRVWAENLSTEFAVNISDFKLGSLNVDVLDDQRLTQENEVLDYEMRAAVKYTFNNRLDIHTGYQLRETGVINFGRINRPAFSSFVKDVEISHAPFVEANWVSPKKNTFFEAGIRFNYYDKLNEFRIEPRLVLTHQVSPALSFELQGEMKSQAIAQVIDQRNDFLGVEKRRWVIADGLSIPLALGQQLSLGLNYDRNRFLVSIEGYFKDVEGIISSGQGFQNQFQFVRAKGSYQIWGFDALVNRQFERVNTWFGYSYSTNNYRFPTLVPPDFPNNLDIRHIFNFGSSVRIGNVNLSVGLHWHSGRVYTPALSADGPSVRLINYASPNSRVLPDYLRIDFSATYKFPIARKANAHIGASVWNLSNSDNVINSYYRVDPHGNPIHLAENGLALTPNLVFRVDF